MLAAETDRGSACCAGSGTAAASPSPVAKIQRKIIAANCAERGQMSARSLSEVAMDEYAEALNCAQSESNPNLIGPPSMRRTLWFTQRQYARANCRTTAA